MGKFQTIFGVNHRAFMLIELIIVMLIMGFFSIIILTRNPSDNVTLAGESEIIRSHLRYVRNLALSDDKDSWSLKFTDDPGYRLVNKEFGFIPLPGEEYLTHYLPPGYSISVQRDDGAGIDEIFFGKWGAPADGMNYLITVKSAETSEKIKLLKNTGFIQ